MPQLTPRTLSALAALSLLALGCGGDVAAPVPQPSIVIVAGDLQSALANTELPETLIALVRDGNDRPIAHTKVAWVAAAGTHDVVTAIDSFTDLQGKAHARWTIDSTVGMHTLSAAAQGSLVAQATAYASTRPVTDVEQLPIQTYDGSGEAVHPDFVRVPSSWAGDPFRLVATPYPGGNQLYENPSFFTGSTGTSWQVPIGVSNPLETPLNGYYSDPDVLYDPDANELRIYYRSVNEENVIFMIRSGNGVLWSAPVVVARAPNHMIVSPAVVRRSATEWLMWSVNAGTIGCGGPNTVVELRRSRDGVLWTNPEPTSLDERSGFAWHIDVQWIPSRSEYWSVYPIKRAGGCVTDRLGFATSADGVHWQSYPSPVLVKGASDEMRDIVYRSSIDYDDAADVVSIWYSGATILKSRTAYRWHLGWERMSLRTLFTRVNVPVWEAARTDAEPDLPPLTNETAP